MDTSAQLGRIMRNVMDAEHDLERIREARAKIKRFPDTLYDGIPTEDWQTRGGNKFLYLVFRKRGDDTYEGPEGKRKIYIGSKPVEIDYARAKVENRRTLDCLTEAEGRLDYWIREIYGMVNRLATCSGQHSGASRTMIDNLLGEDRYYTMRIGDAAAAAAPAGRPQ